MRVRISRDQVLWGVTAVCLLGLAAALLFRQQLSLLLFQPTTSRIPAAEQKAEPASITRLANKLDTPWSLAFLPSGDLLVTERGGTLRQIGEDGASHTIDGVQETSEGGLLGVAVHPAFSTNRWVYVYLTTEQGSALTNRVDRYELVDSELRQRKTIVENIPAASNHNGGGIAFGPDSKLYVTTGDAAQPELAQDTTSLAGKLLRLEEDGAVPADNPFDNLVWSYGHRNPQGITWDDKGRLWSVEHGPSGGLNGTGKDELNLIEKGANYGWPVIAGSQKQAGMKSPVAQSGSDETWAPAGLAYAGGSLYFGGLRGQALYEARIAPDASVVLSRHFVQEYGRLRAVAVNDSYLYVSTSNRDGRGQPSASDDTIVKIDLRSAWRND